MNPLITLLPPLLLIPFIILFGERLRNFREASILIAGIILFIMNLVIYKAYVAGEVVESAAFTVFGPWTLQLKAEPMGVMFGLLASFLWVITTIYSIGYMRGHDEKNQTRFYVCFAIAIAMVMAAAYSANLLTLFVAYEVITLSTYPLVTHAGTADAKRGGRIYLGMLMGGSIALLLPAMIVIAWLAGTLDFVPGGIIQENALSQGLMILLFAAVIFGTGKAALMPFHAWLPNAMVAPTPVSALLHAVAVVKTGVFLILKVVVYTFGIDTLQATGAADYFVYLAAFTILMSSMIAMTKDNLKARLAYSTISQLAYIILAAVLVNELAITGGALHIITHAFGKITLFFCAGAIMVSLHKKKVSELAGIGKQMPWTMAAFFIAALSIIGLPPLAGIWSKVAISEGAISAGQYWILVVLMLSSLLNIAYLIPIPIKAFFAKAETTTELHYKEAPLPCLVAIAVTVGACFVFFMVPHLVLDLLALIQWR